MTSNEAVIFLHGSTKLRNLSYTNLKLLVVFKFQLRVLYVSELEHDNNKEPRFVIQRKNYALKPYHLEPTHDEYFL